MEFLINARKFAYYRRMGGDYGVSSRFDGWSTASGQPHTSLSLVEIRQATIDDVTVV